MHAARMNLLASWVIYMFTDIVIFGRTGTEYDVRDCKDVAEACIARDVYRNPRVSGSTLLFSW